MVAVAVVTTPNDERAPDSVPRRIFEAVPDLEIEVERFVPLGDSAIPFIWVRAEELGAFERAVRSYPEVSTVERLERVEDGALYRMDWEVDSPMIHCMQRAGARIAEAHGTVERWKLTLWLDTGDDASSLLRCCQERDVPIEVDRLQSVAAAANGEEVVTSRQREALEAAYEQGYYEKPREISQRELAGQLGISAAALGTRLRRGTANIVEDQFIE